MLENEPREAPRLARLGLVGAGPASYHFVRALKRSGVAEVVAQYATSGGTASESASPAPDAPACDDLNHVLSSDIDGIIIATPTAEHVAQAEAAIERGIAVFCQRPLGRDALETRRVIDAARSANVLLGVDMTFRPAEAMRVLRSTVQAGELGDIYAVDAIFHNASSPENIWATDPQLSGGGCVMDGGFSMIDLVLWTLGFPRVTNVDSRLFANGERVGSSSTSGGGRHAVLAENYATALLDLDTGVTVHLACSWNFSTGRNARIELTFYGTEGAGTFYNVDGSFTNFTSELFNGTHRHTLFNRSDDWAGRTVVSWASALARGGRYDPWVEGVADVAAAIDHILGKS